MKTNHKKRGAFIRMFSFLDKWKPAYFINVFILTALFAFERPFTAFIFKWLADSILGKDLHALRNVVIINVLLLVFWVPLIILFQFLWRRVLIKAIADLRQSVFHHLQRLPLSFHEKKHSGEIVSLMTNDISMAEQGFQQAIFNLISGTVGGVTALIFMLFLDWRLGVIGVLCGVIPVVINTLFAKPIRNVSGTIQENLSETSTRMTDLIEGYEVSRTFNLSDWITSRFRQANDLLYQNNMRRVRLFAALQGSNSFSNLFNWFIPLAAGMFLVLNGETSMGTYYAYMIVFGSLRRFMSTLADTISGVQRSLAGAERILEILDEDQEPDSYSDYKTDTTKKPQPDTFIEFNTVSFGYDDDRQVLNDLSFDISEGTTAAFVGPSGGGKSTILKLLLGCYPITSGGVFIQGESLNTYPLSELRQSFAYIPQDTFLYSGTIMDNIRYGRMDATEDEIIEAAKAAYAFDFVSRFPDGFQTKVGERGARLSGGERQRIAIARALLRDAPILLLDEATSALDSESEELVQRALDVLMKDRTVLIIAHRLSTIETADIIFTIDEGKVIEMGTHHDLLQLNGLYYRLYHQRFDTQIAEVS